MRTAGHSQATNNHYDQHKDNQTLPEHKLYFVLGVSYGDKLCLLTSKSKKCDGCPTVDIVSKRFLQLSQCVSPGTELQQPQGQGDAHWGHNQVGVVLCLYERLVETDGESGVQLPHAVL